MSAQLAVDWIRRVGELTQSERIKMIRPYQARAAGLVVIDGAGGTPQGIYTKEEHEARLSGGPFPGPLDRVR